MRRIRFTLVCLTVLLSGCNEEIKNIVPDNGTGTVHIALTSEPDNREPVVKADDNISSHLGDFTVEIANSSGKCLYCEKFSDAEGTAIPLNTGIYTLTAQYGNPKTAGFNAIYYKAEKQFEVHPQVHENISAVAKMAKTKVAVEYGEHLRLDDCDYYVDIQYGSGDNAVKFSKSETRAAYIPAGKITPVFHYDFNGEWHIYRAKSITGSPNDFITFNIDISPDVNPDGGTVNISVTVDTSVEVIEEELETTYIEFTGKKPTLTIISDSPGNTELRVYPDQRAGKHKARVDAYAPDGIRRCLLQIKSPYLESLGVPEEVDLANISDTVGDLLWEYGIRWFKDMKGKRLTYVDLEGYATHIAAMKYDPDNTKDANFKIIVEDMNNQSAETSFARFIEVKPEFTLEANMTNVYASKVINVRAVLKKDTGNPESLILEYTSASDPNFSDWRRAEVTDNGEFDTDEEHINIYADMVGLKPGTPYRMRLRYRNSDKLSSYLDITTEDAQQVGNAGFEDWSYKTIEHRGLFGSSAGTTYVYYPYTENSSEKWWASNNEQTASSNYSTYPYFKCFPTVWPAGGRNGGKAAQITAVAVDGANSEIYHTGSTQGELFIGTWNGNRRHAFGSRPSAMSFWYKYAPEGDDTWQATVEVLNGSTVIGKGSYMNSSSADSWTPATIVIEYTNTKLKATGIYVRFIQSTSTSPTTAKKDVVTPDGTYTIYGGSQLTVDDVEMIYN